MYIGDVVLLQGRLSDSPVPMSDAVGRHRPPVSSAVLSTFQRARHGQRALRLHVARRTLHEMPANVRLHFSATDICGLYCYVRPHRPYYVRRSTVVDAVFCYTDRVAWSVGLSDRRKKTDCLSNAMDRPSNQFFPSVSLCVC